MTIGVVVSHFNRHEFLHRCLKSMEKWKGLPVEILVVDGGSHEPPWRRLSPDADYILEIEETDIQKCRNVGYRFFRDVVEADYILFSDCDIWWKSDALKKLHQALDSHPKSFGYAYCDYQRSGALDGPWISGGFDCDRLQIANFISTMSLIRMEALQDLEKTSQLERGFPFIEDEERLQDWSLWLRFLKMGKKGVYVPEILFEAHYDPDSISLRDGDDYSFWRDEIRGRYVPGFSGTISAARS